MVPFLKIAILDKKEIPKQTRGLCTILPAAIEIVGQPLKRAEIWPLEVGLAV